MPGSENKPDDLIKAISVNGIVKMPPRFLEVFSLNIKKSISILKDNMRRIVSRRMLNE